MRAVVVTGAGRAFCAGADLSRGEHAFDGAGARAAAARAQAALALAGAEAGVAAMNGHAIGVGLTMPMQCDVRFVAEDAKLAFAFVRRGVIPELASHVIVVARGGPLARRRSAALGPHLQRPRGRGDGPREPRAARRRGAARRARLGARRRRCTPRRPRSRSRSACSGRASPTRCRRCSRKEEALFDWIRRQPDAVEGVVAFVEKRAPRWKTTRERHAELALAERAPRPWISALSATGGSGEAGTSVEALLRMGRQW